MFDNIENQFERNGNETIDRVVKDFSFAGVFEIQRLCSIIFINFEAKIEKVIVPIHLTLQN